MRENDDGRKFAPPPRRSNASGYTPPVAPALLQPTAQAATAVLAVTLTATGAGLVWLSAEDTIGFFLQALHVVLGLLACLPLTLVCWRHARLRGMDRVGLSAAVALGVVLTSGLVLTVPALVKLTPPHVFVPVHLWSTVALTVLSLAHLAMVLARRAAVERVGRRLGLPALAGTALSLALAVGLGLALERSAQSRVNSAGSAGYEVPYGESPFAPSNVRVADDRLLTESQLAGSLACRACHATIYDQWSESMHRHSATDPHVAVGVRWFIRDNGVAAGRFCAGCHDPIGLVTGRYTAASTSVGLNTADVGVAPHAEGISCLSCHAITALHEPRDAPFGNGSYVLAPRERPVFEGWLYDANIRLDPKEHGRALMKRPLMQEARYCGSCHQQALPEGLVHGEPEAMAHLHHQLPEWEKSPYAQPGPEHKTCNDCHMPLVAGVDPAAKDGKIHSHRFVGANHAHAVASGYEEQARLTLELLRKAVTMQVSAAPSTTGDAVPAGKAALVVEVAVKNVGAGHSFPSGTTDLSETWLEVIAGDPEAPLYTSGLLGKDHYLDPKAHVWKSVYVDVANVPIDLHNLASLRRIASHRVIRAGATDTARFVIPVAPGSGDIPVRVRLRMRKANQRWNDWLSNFAGTTVPVTDILESEVTLPAPAVAAVAPALPPATPTAATPPPGMVLVPAGPAIIGSEDGDADERPVATIDVPAFFIDRFPVTNAQYRELLVAKRLPGPVHKLPWATKFNWTGQDFPPGTAERAVVLVNHEEASAYCAFRQKRLVTEIEWEKAARGPHGRRYPWGDDWAQGNCPNVAGLEIPQRVGMCPQRASPYGIQDLVGGVFEWTEDRYGAYRREHLHPNENEWVTTYGDPSFTLRGVPSGQEGPATTASSRAGHADNMRARIGFRCARSVDPATRPPLTYQPAEGRAP